MLFKTPFQLLGTPHQSLSDAAFPHEHQLPYRQLFPSVAWSLTGMLIGTREKTPTLSPLMVWVKPAPQPDDLGYIGRPLGLCTGLTELHRRRLPTWDATVVTVSIKRTPMLSRHACAALLTAGLYIDPG
ncbi:hypothetical protein N7G274_005411 [Stereocaulon virgatum]|uniref:Uncharacterized protein n=1 Tax=Stereocaulon virgatum TaxID=373712 RepID=A0ABR4AAW6_9LECA